MTRIEGAWLSNAGAQAIFDVLGQHQAFFVGGCVRNALVGDDVADVDIATDAHPKAVLGLAEAAGLEAIPTGIDHGTVTIVSDGVPYEVTTYRRDVSTDGRRAVVSYSDTMHDDAERRDFTMNALYADRAGRVLDPLGVGLRDLSNREVRFIGDAVQRVREDYLRILRYFRFFATYGDPAKGVDPEAMAAIAEGTSGLDSLSRERVGAELLKLLSARDPAFALASMEHSGVLARVLPGALSAPISVLVHLEEAADAAPDPIRRLATLVAGLDRDALRLSRAQARVLEKVASAARDGGDPSVLGYRLGQATGQDAMLVHLALTGQNWSDDLERRVNMGADMRFPVSPADLMPEWEGAALGQRLKDLEDRWIASGFSLTKAELLAAD